VLRREAVPQLEAHIQRVLALVETKWPPSSRIIEYTRHNTTRSINHSSKSRHTNLMLQGTVRLHGRGRGGVAAPAPGAPGPRAPVHQGRAQAHTRTP
jgi:hypothetical protein